MSSERNVERVNRATDENRAAQERRARRWGRKNGYKGRAGGWIYDADGRPVCQGWWMLWHKFRDRIDGPPSG